MVQFIGLILVVVLVLGALFSVGDGVLSALPFELLLICGAALGTLLLGNSPATSRKALLGLGVAFRGSKWTKADFGDLLSLCYGLSRDARRGGLVAIEKDIEAPFESRRFLRFEKLVKDTGLVATISDGFRFLGLDLSDPARAEDALRQSIEAERDQRHRAASALYTIADALPALGIVAAVIGIIRAMSVIDQSPDVIGAMMASALLGTFLGVFLAYGVVGPIANRFSQSIDDDLMMNEVAATFISAHGRGLPARAAAEIARSLLPAHLQPSLDSLTHAFQAERFGRSEPNRAA